jgi:hypothetical protein
MNIADGQPDRQLAPQIKDTSTDSKTLERSTPDVLRFSGIWCHIKVEEGVRIIRARLVQCWVGNSYGEVIGAIFTNQQSWK